MYCAFSSVGVGPDRGWGSPLAHQSLCADAGHYQVNLEWRRGHSRCVVAAQCLRAGHVFVEDSRREVTAGFPLGIRIAVILGARGRLAEEWKSYG
jgi:hypothetical protein